MWLLRNDEKGQIYRVTPGKQHVVSRKDGDLLLVGDQSISRKHAQLLVLDENVNEGIIVADLGSKYGSFATIREGELTRLEKDEQVTLRDGDFVRFGSQWNSWRAEFVPLVVATSTLSQQEKTAVKEMVEALGGQLVSEWTEQCTHITMNKLTVTVKVGPSYKAHRPDLNKVSVYIPAASIEHYQTVVCALAAGQPIVTPEFWRCYSEALSRLQSTLPDPDSFLPPLAEAILNPSEVSFAPNPARGKLFEGLTFVAATAKQAARIRPMITAAGGNVIDFSSKSWSENQLMETNFILMQHSPAERQGSQHSQAPDGYNPIARKMRAAGVRCVPESEIGLSVIYCSISRFCNPRYTPSLLRPTQGRSGDATQPVPVVCPSSESSVSSGNYVDCEENTVPNKRLLEDPHEDGAPPKKEAKRQNSQDMFESQGPTVAPNQKSLRQTPLNFQRIDESGSSKAKTSNNIDPSLDMFAPSGSTSGSSKPKTSNNAAPSLDLFAPSGSRSCDVTVEEPKVKPALPSCEDIFASDNDQQSNEKSSGKNELPRKANQPLRNVTNGDDEFSFASSSKQKRPRDVVADENDEFSFVQTKRPNVKTVENNEDEFSFTSARKRNRPSDPDIFASSGDSPGRESISSVSKIRKTDTKNDSLSSSKFQIQHSSRNGDHLFAFANDRKSKKMSSNISIARGLESGDEVKLAILSTKKESASEYNGVQNNEAQMYVQPDRNDLVTYSKTIPDQDNIKTEVKEEEVDVLARELQETTIVIVTSLLANRDKPPATQPSVGKNFKKFQKVSGVKKRLIPKIIGGSDLVPYCENARNSPSPPPMAAPQKSASQDVWSFGNSRKKGEMFQF